MIHVLSFVIAAALAAERGEPTSYPLGGASRPRPQMRLANPEGQYKRIHQFALRLIELGRLDEAASFLERHQAAHPDDPETLFLLGVLNARRNRVDAAVSFLQQAIQAGLPPGRVIAGPRELFEPLRDTGFYRGWRERLARHPIHGPMVGSVTDHSAAIWVRTAAEARVEVVAGKTPELNDAVRSPAVQSTAESDFTAVARLEGLEPDTTYSYAVLIDGQGDRTPAADQHFRTFPRRGQPARFVIAFGGGAGYVPPHERMWDTVRSFHPLALLLLGDNVYIDDPESTIMQRFTYYRRQSRPEFRRLVAQTAVFSIWDDHDFSTNDSWGGPLIDTPFWKKQYCYPIFKQNWVNPGYGGGDQQPGCWYAFSINDVDFIMLDCRYYRTNPREDNPSMLGPVQLAWLKDQLRAARGTFKVLCSSVPWDFRTKGDSLDTWNGFREEREDIFRFIEAHRIEGVVLMSADRHRSDAWRIERPNGYDFYEFNSSRLTNQHVHPTMEKAGALFSYNAKQSFGLVRFDTMAEDPTVTYSVVTIDGETVHQLAVRRSQLSFRRP